jgi:hypothetical protein
MGKIHVLPTDNPSRLHLGKSGLVLCDFVFDKSTINGQHIYITSDVEIKEGDWFLRKSKIHKLRYNDGNGNLWTKNGLKIYASNSKKIILTTDQDLITDGVQAIDNEFLQWYVKNQDCEYVEVEDFPTTEKYNSKGEYIHNSNWIYKIIIPQEEPAQSAIEFLFRRYMDNQQKLTLADFIEASEIEDKIIDELTKKTDDE